MMLIKHAAECAARTQHQEAWKQRWPTHCCICIGVGTKYFSDFDIGYSADDPCPGCTDRVSHTAEINTVIIEFTYCPRCSCGDLRMDGSSPCPSCSWNWCEGDDDAAPEHECMCDYYNEMPNPAFDRLWQQEVYKPLSPEEMATGTPFD